MNRWADTNDDRHDERDEQNEYDWREVSRLRRRPDHHVDPYDLPDRDWLDEDEDDDDHDAR